MSGDRTRPLCLTVSAGRGNRRHMAGVVPMKKMIIRAIGVLLIVLGTIKAYGCICVVVLFIPILFENGMSSIGIHAGMINLVMAAIDVSKIVGGFGLLWLKSWAKWTAVVASSLHVLIISYFVIPIWIKMAQGAFENPASIPLWKDYVSIAVNIAIAITLLALFKRKSKILAQQGDGD